MKMKIFHLLFLTLIMFNAVFTEEAEEEINCSDLDASFIGSIFKLLANDEIQNDTETGFYLATTKNADLVEIGNNNWSGLNSSSFNPLEKTYIIIHGFQSHCQKEWVLEMKEELQKVRNINIILVDWKNSSNRWNYVDSTKSTLLVRYDIFNFLEELKTVIGNLNSNSIHWWNHLYFIGHSLGAHISGQVSHLLKQDNFFKVERITGLDPAKPCFVNVSSSLKLDKDDADFVDIIHTQTGIGGYNDGLGLEEAVGHADFYVNGGVMQAGCEGSYINVELNRMICSHKLASKYFTESIINSESNTCKFLGYRWNRTYEGALQVLNDIENNLTCENCPEMGFDATKDKGIGTFLIITGSESPFCKFENKDIMEVNKSIERLKEEPASSTIMTDEFWYDFNNIFK